VLSVLSLPMIGAFPLFFEVRGCAQGLCQGLRRSRHQTRRKPGSGRRSSSLVLRSHHFSCLVARRGHTPHYCFSLNGLLRPEDTCKG